MRAVLSLAFVLAALAATPASAWCPSQPDNASTGYVGNNTATAVCLQRQLAADTSQAAAQARIEAELRNLQLEINRQQLPAPLPILPVWPRP